MRLYSYALYAIPVLVLAGIVAVGVHERQGGLQSGEADSDHVPRLAEADAASPGVDHQPRSLRHPNEPHDADAPCACPDAIRTDGWCPKCDVGYVAGRPIESELLFETLDPHGHPIELKGLRCDACEDAYHVDGFCAECNRGFHDRMTYFSELTYGLAHGHWTDDAARQCSDCESGWCESHRRGMVGNVSISDRAMFLRTAAEFANLHQAIERGATCDLCACAMVVRGRCPKCRISYRTASLNDGSAALQQVQLKSRDGVEAP